MIASGGLARNPERAASVSFTRCDPTLGDNRSLSSQRRCRRMALGPVHEPVEDDARRQHVTLIEGKSGRTGIRTLERVAPLTVFKTVAFVRSAILPASILTGSRRSPACRAATNNGGPW